jgi:carbonic anhydrase
MRPTAITNRLFHAAIVSITVSALGASTALSATDSSGWHKVASGTESIEIDGSRLSYAGNTLVSVWSRVRLGQIQSDAEGRYNSIEALNRYDCASSRFATLKRLYLLDEMLVRTEPVLMPRDMLATTGSPATAILKEVCRTKPSLTAQMPDVVSRDYGEAVAATDADTFRFLKVADHVATSVPSANKADSKPEEAASATEAAAKRFINLPRIDPSQVQHPSDQPRQANSANLAEAMKSEASKAGVAFGVAQSASASNGAAMSVNDRHAREVALATSGPRRVARRTPPKVEPTDLGSPAGDSLHGDIHWDYEGEGLPSNWAKLRPDFNLCGSGKRQSPIDIHDGIRVDLEPIRFDYKPTQFRIIDNGHTIQINVGDGAGEKSSITVMGRTYRLSQLHFHRPSEERIDGKTFEMVMHMVHKDDEGHLAVVAVLLERGAEHPIIQTFWNNLPLETNMELAPAIAIDLNKLLPETRNYYTYMGSLTTPPCTEGVLWLVMKQPLQLSAEQIGIFARLYKNNARPIQAGNARLVKESR